MAKAIENTEEKKPKKEKYKYLTLVLRYYDKGLKNSYDVTEVVTCMLESLKSFNKNANYDDYRFDLYGVCVEEETDMVDAKNAFVQSIDKSTMD